MDESHAEDVEELEETWKRIVKKRKQRREKQTLESEDEQRKNLDTTVGRRQATVRQETEKGKSKKAWTGTKVDTW